MHSFLLVFEFLGTTELLVIAVVALILFGPRKLPEIGRTVGKAIGEFKRASDDFKRTWEYEVEIEQRKPATDPAPAVHGGETRDGGGAPGLRRGRGRLRRLAASNGRRPSPRSRAARRRRTSARTSRGPPTSTRGTWRRAARRRGPADKDDDELNAS